MLTASISWNYSLSDNTGFLLQRSTDSASTWTINYPTPASQTSYLDMTIEPYVTYSYHVAPTNKYGTGSWSNIGIVPVPGGGDPPAAIPILRASAPVGGYKICGWDTVLSQMTTSSCNPSVSPEWDGVFNQMSTTMPGFNGSDSSVIPLPVWYFTGRSIGGNSVSADEAPDWPDNDWQMFDNITRIFWSWDSNLWTLEIACAGGSNIWWFGRGDSTDINNPSGNYTNDNVTGISTMPETIVIKALSDTC